MKLQFSCFRRSYRGFAWYRGADLVPRLRHSIARAAHPEKLRFGICWEHDKSEDLSEFLADSRFRVVDVPRRNTKVAAQPAFAEENKLPAAAVENKAGKFVSPTAEGASAAIDAFSSELSKDIRTSIVDPSASAANAYPISD